MKNKTKTMLMMLFASAVAAHALSYPPVLKPEEIPAGSNSNPTTRLLYLWENVTAGTDTVYTIWTAPPFVAPATPLRIPSILTWGFSTVTGGVATNIGGTTITREDLAHALANWDTLPAGYIQILFTGLLKDTDDFNQDDVRSLVEKLGETAASGVIYGAENSVLNPLSSRQANAMLISFLSIDRYMKTPPYLASALKPDNAQALPQAEFNPLFTPEFLSELRANDAFRTLNFSPAALPTSWTQAGGWKANSSAGFQNLNLSGVQGLSAGNLKALPASGMTGWNLVGTGITRSMLSTPPNARPAAELNSIVFE